MVECILGVVFSEEQQLGFGGCYAIYSCACVLDESSIKYDEIDLMSSTKLNSKLNDKAIQGFLSNRQDI